MTIQPYPGVQVEIVASAVRPIAGVATSTAAFIGVVPDGLPYPADPNAKKTARKVVALPVPVASPVTDLQLCTSFSDFVRWFGDFSVDVGQNILAHAVYGFFENGGTRCYVSRAASTAGDTDALGKAFERTLAKLEAIDDVAIVAAPGRVDPNVRAKITAHCERCGDRFAILDLAEDKVSGKPAELGLPDNTPVAATYMPWISVFDPATAGPDRTRFVPPSGHVAGIYARVDHERGVHKAPANEVVRGALGLKVRIGKADQGALNAAGVNAIRVLGGNILVWGARTIGGDANGEWKYVNVRRLLMFLQESIDEGTQWAVFEPNDSSLWAKITRNVTAFLTDVWRDGALFGDTPQQAFYVKCDAETNPPDQREIGHVVTEIGVAVVEPAEFVVFRMSQWSGPEG